MLNHAIHPLPLLCVAVRAVGSGRGRRGGRRAGWGRGCLCACGHSCGAASDVGSTDGVRDVLEPKSYATMPTTVPTYHATTMPTTMPTRTVSTVSTVRTLRYGGSTLQYGLYGTKYLLLLYGTVSSGPITCYPITMLPWYQLVRGSTSSSGSNTSLCRRVQIAPTKRLRGCPRPPPAPRQLQRRLRRVKTAKTVGLRASGSSTPPQSHTSAPRRPQ